MYTGNNPIERKHKRTMELLMWKIASSQTTLLIVIAFELFIAVFLLLNTGLVTPGQVQPSASQACTAIGNVVTPKTTGVTGTTATTSTVILPEVKYVTGTIALTNRVTLQIDNLSTYLDRTEQSAHTIVPFINGLPLKGIHPKCIDKDRDQLQFILARNSENKDTIDSILSSSLYDDNVTDFKHEVLISAGYEDEDPFPIKYQDPQFFFVAEPGWFWWGVSLSIAAIIILFASAIAFNLLRITITSNKIQDFLTEYRWLKLKPAYSLGLCQVSWWFILIFTSFIFLNVVTWNINTITAGTVGLLGISVATAVGSVAINNSNQTDEKIETILKDYRKRIDEIAKNHGTTVENATPDQRKRIREEARKEVQTKRKLLLSENIIYDILNDVNGGGLNRVQIIIWTLVLGGMFIWTVGRTLKMPEFDTTLLALIGLSAGTYIGLKIPEKPS